MKSRRSTGQLGSLSLSLALVFTLASADAAAAKSKKKAPAAEAEDTSSESVEETAADSSSGTRVIESETETRTDPAEESRPAPRAKARAKSADDADMPAKKEEEPEYRFDFGLLGGGHLFTEQHVLGGNDSTISPTNAGLFGANLGLHFNRWIGLEIEAVGIPSHSRDAQVREWVFGYRGSFVVHLTDTYVFQPFILAGYGGLTSLAGSVAEGQTPVPNKSWGFVHAGGGFKIGFTPQVGLRFDARALAPWTFILPLSGYAGAKGPDVELIGGLYINFSEIEKVHIYSNQRVIKEKVIISKSRADKDGDGIPDDVDRCPNEPEDRDGFQDDDGCPDPDNDNDGIPDVLDKCPNDPEDKDGFQDEDGCPDYDNDKDGIPDRLDKCPNDPEDRDGFQDDDGCPDPDNDKDGIPDTLDKCPNQPETFNHYQDEDGCPDEIPPEVKKFTGVIEGINFKTGSAEILPGSYAILDRALKVLTDFPDVNLEISGHTDNKGKAEYNRNLSQQRANSVKLYFVSRGVASNRLTSIGYGMDRPVADNSTPSGRATNRRTEFRLIDVDKK